VEVELGTVPAADLDAAVAGKKVEPLERIVEEVALESLRDLVVGDHPAADPERVLGRDRAPVCDLDPLRHAGTDPEAESGVGAGVRAARELRRESRPRVGAPVGETDARSARVR